MDDRSTATEIGSLQPEGLTLTPYPFKEALDFDKGRFTILNRHKIDRLLADLRGKGVKSVNLEGGHIYTDEIPTMGHLLHLRSTAHLREILEAERMQVRTTLFVDNFHPTEHRLDVAGYMRTAADLGLPLDELVWEASLEGEALSNRDTLLRAGLARQEESGRTILNQRKVHLTKENGRPSCAMLDATLSVRKLQAHDAGTIVLPDSYADEQRNMQTILRHLAPLRGVDGSIHYFVPIHNG